MAWSDAARRAAAEARRLHAQARARAAGKGQSIAHRWFMERGYARVDNSLRRSLAERIRTIRRAQFLVGPKGALTPGGKMVIKSAAESTAVRNYYRRR
jgi:hypothetical protein